MFINNLGYFLLGFLLKAEFAFAQSGISPIVPGDLNIGFTIYRVTNWLLGFIIALSLLLVVYAAFLFLLGGQSEGNIEKARKIIIWVIVALALGLGARVIISLTLYFIGIFPGASGPLDFLSILFGTFSP